MSAHTQGKSRLLVIIAQRPLGGGKTLSPLPYRGLTSSQTLIPLLLQGFSHSSCTISCKATRGAHHRARTGTRFQSGYR